MWFQRHVLLIVLVCIAVSCLVASDLTFMKSTLLSRRASLRKTNRKFSSSGRIMLANCKSHRRRTEIVCWWRIFKLWRKWQKQGLVLVCPTWLDQIFPEKKSSSWAICRERDVTCFASVNKAGCTTAVGILDVWDHAWRFYMLLRLLLTLLHFSLVVRMHLGQQFKGSIRWLNWPQLSYISLK